jgi:hypothetical protein
VSFLPYALVAGLVVMLAICVGAIALMGVDAHMLNGVVTGAAAGLILMVFAWFTTLKGINSGDTKHALGHVLGGFMLRLVALTAGIFLLHLTGWANAAGFALAFLMTVMVYLAAQIMVALKRIDTSPGKVKTA